MPRWFSLLLLAAAALLAGCGAGLVTGGLLAGGNRGPSTPPPEVRPPSLAVDLPSAPLVPPPPSATVITRTLFLTDYAVRSSDVIRVELRGLNVVQPQLAPVVLSVDGNTTRIAFVYTNDAIFRAVPAPTAADVPCQLAVLVEGKQVAPSIPFVLFRQPLAELVPPASGRNEAFVSVLGTDRIALRVSGLRAATTADLQLQVATRDPTGRQTFLLQFGSDLELRDEPATGKRIVSGILPPSAFPTQALVAVLDRLSGQSTPVDRVYYGPAIQAASPRHGSTDGFGLVAVFGQGLVPLDFTTNPPRPDFTRATLEVQKGGRRTQLPSSFVRTDLSSLNRLVVTVPPSPDGRAGAADLALMLEVGASEPARSDSRALFVYGHREPVFGPRGVVLRERAVDVAFAPFDGTAGAPDLVALLSSGGVPRVQLMLAEDNGTFVRAQGPLDAAAQSSLEQRNPAALCSGDFDRDGLADLFVVNQGTAVNAEHTLMLGRPAPQPMLARVAAVARDAELAHRCATADFDRNGVPDVAVIQNVGASQRSPRVFLGKPRQTGAPEFELVSVTAAGPGPFDAVAADDLDGDGRADLLLGVGGAAPAVVTAYGNGDGSFTLGQRLELRVPGYQPDATAPMVGLHACGPGPRRAIVVVLAGLANSTLTPPAVAVLLPLASPRLHDQPTAAGTTLLVGADAGLGASLAGDLDGDALPELVTGARSPSAAPLRLLRWQNGAFAELAGAVDRSVDPVEAVFELQLQVAVPAGRAGPAPHLAVFALQRAMVDANSEDRVAAWLVAPGPRLVAPDASQTLPEPILALAAVDLAGRGVQDVCCATDRGVLVLRNDGAGGFAAPAREAGTVVPGTLARTRFANRTAESVVWLESDGRLAVLRDGAAPLRTDIDLREFAPAALRGRAIGAGSRVTAGDVDGDGYADLVVAIALPGVPEPRDGETVLLLLRGHKDPADDELPVLLPSRARAAATAHGNATSFALGDLARDLAGPRRLELAVAIPRGDGNGPDLGNHVRFYRYDAAGDVLVRSFAEEDAQVLIAGDQPFQLAVADLDVDGSEDLVVASGGDAKLRVFLNDAQRPRPPGRALDVHVRALAPALNAPPALPAGRPVDLALGQLGGDGLLGVVVAVEDASSGTRDTSFATYRNDGTGDLALAGLVSPTRTGNRVAGALRDKSAHMVLADLNGDRRPELLVGWDSAGAGDANLRVLFGGVR